MLVRVPEMHTFKVQLLQRELTSRTRSLDSHFQPFFVQGYEKSILVLI